MRQHVAHILFCFEAIVKNDDRSGAGRSYGTLEAIVFVKGLCVVVREHVPHNYFMIFYLFNLPAFDASIRWPEEPWISCQRRLEAVRRKIKVEFFLTLA